MRQKHRQCSDCKSDYQCRRVFQQAPENIVEERRLQDDVQMGRLALNVFAEQRQGPGSIVFLQNE